MEDLFKEIVKILTLKKQTISFMESCTGGGLANALTNIPGASEVLKFSATTYSNEYKIKMGVKKDIIDKYSVYSINVAREMAQNIAIFASSNLSVGVTGKLNKEDSFNKAGVNNKVFISIYDKDNNKFYDKEMFVTKTSRKEMKDEVIIMVAKEILNILKEKNDGTN